MAKAKEKTELITLADAAKEAGVSPTALRRAAQKGHLKAQSFGKVWLTTQEAVEIWKQGPHHNPKMRRQKPPTESENL